MGPLLRRCAFMPLEASPENALSRQCDPGQGVSALLHFLPGPPTRDRGRALMMPRMKTKTRTTRKGTAKSKTKSIRKPKAQKKARAQRKPRTRISKNPIAAAAPTGGDSKLLKMPNRLPGTKSDFNLRFATVDDYQLVKTEATSRGMSMNLFITTAALKQAGKKASA